MEGDITVAVLQVTGSIPDDAVVQGRGHEQRQATAAPVWQDVTTEVRKGVNIVFENKTATGWRGIQFPRQRAAAVHPATGGYIEAVSGAFQ